MRLEYQIVMALALDLLLGDPRWLPHPVKMIGRLAGGVEKVSRRVFRNERIAGVFAVLIVLAFTGFIGWLLIRGATLIHPLVGDIASVILLYTCFAGRDLVAHSTRVYKALAAGDLETARQKVSMIVGRDTDRLDEAGIVRATVESVAENTVDGVTAPLFWAVVGGPVGALLYKAINTMDSMFGYKNEKYLRFGTAAARLDDLVNFIPARLTGLLMVAGAALIGLRSGSAWKIMIRDRNNLPSPNSGWSEAPMAGALGIRLGGPTSYFGRIKDYPTMGDAVINPEPAHIRAADRLLIVTVALAMLVFIGVRLMLL